MGCPVVIGTERSNDSNSQSCHGSHVNDDRRVEEICEHREASQCWLKKHIEEQVGYALELDEGLADTCGQ